MDEVKTICPLTKKELPNTCVTCNFCIKENAKDFLKTTTDFKDTILNGN